jgi:hypothetical protein
LPYGYLKNNNGELIETKTHANVLHQLDLKILEKAVDEAGDTQHLKNLGLKNVWVESINDIKHEEYFLFSSKLRVQSLPTPRNIQVCARKFPLLYPDSLCPCKEEVGNEFHIICKCKFLKEARTAFVKQAHKRFTEWIKPRLKNVEIPLELIKFIFFPQNQEDFTFGFIHKRFGEWVKEVGYTDEECDMWISKLEKELLDNYHSMWCSYTRYMDQNKFLLKHRLKEEYSIRVSEMSSKRKQAGGMDGVVPPAPASMPA